jgi:hypothetical protein
VGQCTCTDLFALFFFFFLDKLCTNAITLMVFTGGWGQRCTDLFAFYFYFLLLNYFLHFDRIYCDLCEYYSVCVCICEYLFYIYLRF